jgi:exosortase/archaeosortase family protein
LVLLFTLFYLNITPLATFLNELQRGWLMDSLRYFLGDIVQDIYIYSAPNFRIRITYACNGLIPYYLFLASIFAYPSKWLLKIIWAVVGYFAIYWINLLRLLFVTEMTKSGGQNFWWSHDLIGNLMLMVVGLGLFFLFIRVSDVLNKKWEK